MKLKRYFAFMLVLIMLAGAVTVNAAEEPVVKGQAAVLMDFETGEILYEKNIHETLYPASITKILTVLTALENIESEEDLKKNVTVSSYAVNSIKNWGASNIGVKAGDTMTLEDALYAVMLASACEVSVVVAEYISGSEAEFCKLMNQVAKDNGALNTNFQNSHGLPDSNHYTTAYDMAQIGRAANRHEIFRKIVSTKYHTLTINGSQSKNISNIHKMIFDSSDYYNPDVVGGKTGYTNAAMHTIVSLAEKDGNSLIAVVMKTPQNVIYTDSTALFNYGFGNYAKTELASKETLNGFLSGKKAEVYRSNEKGFVYREFADIFVNEGFSKNLPKNKTYEDLRFELVYPDRIVSPLTYGDEIGKLKIFAKDAFLGEIPLCSGSEYK